MSTTIMSSTSTDPGGSDQPDHRSGLIRGARTRSVRARPRRAGAIEAVRGTTIAPQLRSLAVSIDSVECHPRNPRRGDVQAVAASLARFGQQKAIVVQASTRFVVAGNHLLKAASALRWTEIAANVVDMDDASATAFMLADNRTADLGGYDDALLSAILAEVAAADNLAATGYDGDDVDALIRAAGLAEIHGDPDAVPEVPDEADVYVKTGDLWLLGRHRLLCGDSTNPDDVERLLDGATPRLLVTDPPYGVELNMEWRDGVYNAPSAPAEPSYMRDSTTGEEEPAPTRAGAHGRTAGHRNTTISGDTRADWSAAFALVPGLEVAYVWHASAHVVAVIRGLEAIGFELRQQIVWVKPVAAMSRSAYNWQHEPCLYAVRTGKTAEWTGDTRQTTVWEHPSPKMAAGGGTEERFDHPTQKPSECMASPIRNHRGDVYEPFAGSGTTIIAAEQLGRHCYALEIDPKYAQVAKERWENFTGRTAELAAADGLAVEATVPARQPRPLPPVARRG